jgi:hypothetical protein
VTGPARFSRVLETPAHKLGFYQNIAVLTYPLHHGAGSAHSPIRQMEFKADI